MQVAGLGRKSYGTISNNNTLHFPFTGLGRKSYGTTRTLNLEGNLAESYKEWIQSFELYLTATGIEEKSGKVQVAIFLQVAGSEAQRVYNTFDIVADDKEKIDVLKDRFKGYCDIQWHWDHEQHQSFEVLKQLVSSAPVLRFYNVNEPVTISVDASSKGLGVVLLQNKQLVAYGSRALTETQSRYAQIEREMLAICTFCEKFDHYIYGRRAVIETDHNPLVAIYDKRLIELHHVYNAC
ncbi:unnamed protein product [Mytilus edulis]|uniref:Reverse transcriptase/retrotransposon-derived protein RNase H-like domain-containing protein n=1 Tax=Mytilus edulis TaxID=6550 RepID=A0A8S3RUS8_MYTED|nr:unnamed protein product [Mytilus edulis]